MASKRATKLEEALATQKALESTVEFLETEIRMSVATPLSASEINHLLKVADNANADVINIHTDLVQYSEDADRATHTSTYINLMRRITKVIGSLNGFQLKLNTPASVTREVEADVKLPKLELPLFDGDLQSWVSFRDLFSTAVHNNPKLSKSQKFTYLKSQLRGEAARLIQSMVITDSNYDIAWTQLSSRYHNERELLFTIMKRLFSQTIIVEAQSKAIRQLIDTTRECIRSLEILQCPTEHYDSFIIYVLFTKLDSTSRELWEQNLKDSSIPSLDAMYNFLEARARSLAAAETSQEVKHAKRADRFAQSPKIQKIKTQVHHTSTSSHHCVHCNSKSHFIFHCPTFTNLTVEERIDNVKKYNLCFNCLRPEHTVAKCPSHFRCKTCKGQHHSLLHHSKTESTSTKALHTRATSNLRSKNTLPETLLATAQIVLYDSQGRSHLVKAFMDSGAQQNYITESCIKKLCLNKSKCNIQISGLGGNNVGACKGKTQISFAPHFRPDFIMHESALIVSKITGNLPYANLKTTDWTHLNNITLADPEYFKSSAPDVLLGASVFFESIESGKIESQNGGPAAIKSSFGWLIGGQLRTIDPELSLDQATTNTFLTMADENADKLLEKFWEVECCQETKMFSPSDQKTMDHFQSTYTVSKSGRFIVRLPFKHTKPEIGSSYEVARRRLCSMERRLEIHPEHRSDYNAFMQEYKNLGHMKQFEYTGSNTQYCFIPHQFVLKAESSTTKFRVVFDASAKTSNGLSLNDNLLVGPTVQSSLYDILLRFRLHKVAFTADISKMYRQIEVHPDDQPYQCVLWREHPKEPIQHFMLTTVTYGTACAPFLATQCLNQLASLKSSQCPSACTVLKRDFYVDDLMSREASLKRAKKMYVALSELVSSAGFVLRKWASNSLELLNTIPMSDREMSNVEFQDGATVKSLGTRWNPGDDNFQYKFNHITKPDASTKRNVLSMIAKIFDPVGWLAPIIVRAKILMQQIWLSGIAWDDMLPEQLQLQWNEFVEELHKISEICIPRWYFTSNSASDIHCLIGYCDASEKAYGACVYIVCYNENILISSNLVTAKTRVSPSKTQSLPRLELCSALLLAELMHSVKRAIEIDIQHISAWSDSLVALSWIRGHPSKWRTFVANRVTKIQDLIPIRQWGHIAGVNNPADCASRGLKLCDLRSYQEWWTGPQLLKNGIPEPNMPTTDSAETMKEMKPQSTKVMLTFESSFCEPFIRRFSTLTRLIRVTATIMRFAAKCKKKELCKNTISCDEIAEAKAKIIRLIQSTYYSSELSHLKLGKLLPKSCPILPLAPFIDEDGILRVGGRLKQAAIPHNQKHPIILPKNSKLAVLLIQHEHSRSAHGGPQLVLSLIQQNYWIVGGRDLIRRLILRCVLCAKLKSKTMQTLMSELPAFRINPVRAFHRCGVDYAGPFSLRTINRSKITIKCYLCIFVCVTTRAVHLEVVSSLSTDAFLAAFKRFVSRRGLPCDVYSDCGTNFQGAAKEMIELQQLLLNCNHNDTISNHLASIGTRWHFNPPASPHFGGLWEAGVKSVKHHLRRLMYNRRLTFEEFTTVLTQVEAILNSRPIMPESTDPSDLRALTPGHFLIGAPLLAVPEQSLVETPENRLSRWQLLQQLTQHFWQRWLNEYLTRLQSRPKWLYPEKSIAKDDLVVVKDNLPQQQWRLGRVIDLHPGKDGNIRVVTLKTSNGSLTRPITKLCLLPVKD